MPVIRFGVSLEKELLDALDGFVEENLFVNRSQAIRHLISNGLAESKWQCNNEVAGSLTMIYDHHRRGLVAQLTRLQHERNNLILSSLHLHLDHGQCMELLAVRGRAAELTALADKLRSVKGVRYARLTLTRLTGEEHHDER
ncbi:MAG: nickel-responsive transcriptional regulator NikR [Bacteroidales bacterium]|nr:nickel-responsive transcriptional regulator NikR [Bacteroidales bacterium]MDT8372454.1 nickel-responsive transcriptional regulator NikR [Bacteroidales bacterium]